MDEMSSETGEESLSDADHSAMPNSKVQAPSPPTVSNAKLERKLRLSLPEKEKSLPNAAGSRRNTISEDSVPRVRKKSKTPTNPAIPEVEDESVEREPEIEIRVVNEKELIRSTSTSSKRSAASSRATKSSFTYDNGAFEGNLKSTSEPRPASRTPSVRSLEVYREQYCCCAKRTKCERWLLVAVTILAIIVIVLVIVIAVLAKNGDFDSLNSKVLNVKL